MAVKERHDVPQLDMSKLLIAIDEHELSWNKLIIIKFHTKHWLILAMHFGASFHVVEKT